MPRDQIFRVLLQHFISESCAQVIAASNVLGSFSAFCYQFCEQVTMMEKTFEDFWCIISLILCKSCCGSNCYISFRVFYH